jgi:hypothetical protein
MLDNSEKHDNGIKLSADDSEENDEFARMKVNVRNEPKKRLLHHRDFLYDKPTELTKFNPRFSFSFN